MSGTILRKSLQRGIRDYLAELHAPELAGYAFLRGMRAGLMSIPSVAVHIPGAAPEFDELESPSKLFAVDVGIRTKCDYTIAHKCEEAEDAHHEVVAIIETALRSDPVRAFVNSESDWIVADDPVTGGTFTLFDGDVLTQPIPHDTSAATLQQLLIAAWGNQSLLITGENGGPWLFDYGFNADAPPFIPDATFLAPSGSAVIFNKVRAGNETQSTQYRVTLAATSHPAHPPDFHLDEFKTPATEFAFDDRAKSFLTVLTFKMTAIPSDGDE